MDEQGFTVWFTGISGSGKSTLAEMLRDEIRGRGLHVEWLHSGKIRRELNRDLGFTRDEIEKNLRRIAYECRMLTRNGTIVIVSAISPYRALRDEFRETIGRFVEVYTRASLEVLQERDSSGLFERARAGEIANVAGVNSPYEEPLAPEIVCDTDQETPEESLRKMAQTLENLGYLTHRPSTAYSSEEEELIRQRLKNLGYI